MWRFSLPLDGDCSYIDNPRIVLEVVTVRSQVTAP